MTFDFDGCPERLPTDASKWRRYAGRDVLPFWVADMDFRAPPPVLEALQARIEHGVLGYTDTPASLEEAVCERLSDRFSWSVKPEWLVWLPGVVPGLNLAAVSAGDPDAPLLIPRPVYYPFLATPANADRPAVHLDLARSEAGDGASRWELPETVLEAAARAHPGSLLLLCNPQNPTGQIGRAHV